MSERPEFLLFENVEPAQRTEVALDVKPIQRHQGARQGSNQTDIQTFYPFSNERILMGRPTSRPRRACASFARINTAARLREDLPPALKRFQAGADRLVRRR